MNEDSYLDASYEDRCEPMYDDFAERDYEDRDYDRDDYDRELEQDEMLAQQELEDFEQADEYFGYYGDE